jgi:hypothetical protein
VHYYSLKYGTFLFFEAIDAMLKDVKYEAAKDNDYEEDVDEDSPTTGLQIDSFQIESRIVSRFATTIISSRVKNWETNAAEVSFSVVIPEEAFIANFTM